MSVLPVAFENSIRIIFLSESDDKGTGTGFDSTGSDKQLWLALS
jgi:hypothetical protein